MIRSEEHYLRVFTNGDTVLIRGKLSEAETKLCPLLGMQVNRSVWRAYRSIAGLETSERGQLEIHTQSGEAIRVPDSRKIAVTEAVTKNQHRDQLAKLKGEFLNRSN